jgi:Zn-dependent M16 (insulinase) family peptidase
MQSTGPLMGVDDSNFEMTFYCGVQGSNPEHAESFKDGVLNVLREVAAKPIDSSLVDAILHQIELHQREINGDGTPYGLSLILNGLVVRFTITIRFKFGMLIVPLLRSKKNSKTQCGYLT